MLDYDSAKELIEQKLEETKKDLYDKEASLNILREALNNTEKEWMFSEGITYEKKELDKRRLEKTKNKLQEEIEKLRIKKKKLEEALANFDSKYRELEKSNKDEFSELDKTDLEVNENEINNAENNEISDYSNLEEDDDDGESSPSFNVSSFLYGESKNYFASLIKEWEKIEQTSESFTSPDETTESNGIKINVMVQTADPIQKTFLYVATFFPKLSHQDFERIVSFLLISNGMNSSIEVDRDEKSDQTTSNNTNFDRSWKEEGILRSDKIMEECKLRSVDLGSFRGIDFTYSHLRDDLKIYFEERSPLYLEEQFRRSKLLLLDQSTSIALNTVELSVEMAKSNPAIHGENWLISLLNLFRFFTISSQLEEFGFSLFGIVQLLSEVSKSEEFDPELFETARLILTNKQKTEEFRLLHNTLSQITPESRGEFLISRVAFLIQKMLEHENLEQAVVRFLKHEINTRHPETVLAVVSRPLKSLNWLDWMKKLLNEKNKTISFHTRQIFFSRLEQSESNIYNLLAEIKNWIPKNNISKQSDYTQSQVYALRLIYKYSRELSDKLNSKYYGCYPSKYQLFANLGDGSIEKKFRLLVEWAFHPGHKHFVKTPLRAASLLISEWFSILFGLGKNVSDSRSITLINQLLLTVIEATSQSEQRDLFKYWNEQTKTLLTEANIAQRARNRSLSDERMKRRSSLIKLIESFKALQRKV